MAGRLVHGQNIAPHGAFHLSHGYLKSYFSLPKDYFTLSISTDSGGLINLRYFYVHLMLAREHAKIDHRTLATAAMRELRGGN